MTNIFKKRVRVLLQRRALRLKRIKARNSLRAGQRVMITNGGFFHGQKGMLINKYSNSFFQIKLDFTGKEYDRVSATSFKTIVEDDSNSKVSTR